MLVLKKFSQDKNNEHDAKLINGEGRTPPCLSMSSKWHIPIHGINRGRAQSATVLSAAREENPHADVYVRILRCRREYTRMPDVHDPHESVLQRPRPLPRRRIVGRFRRIRRDGHERYKEDVLQEYGWQLRGEGGGR